MQNGFKATLKNQRLELRKRVTRLLIAVLVGTLFVPVGSVGITPLIQQAQAATTISNATEFLAIQNNLSGDYTLAASFSLSTSSNASYITGNFTGTLDGAGFNISGLSKPLFNKIGDGTSNKGVSNLRLITSTVVGGGVLANILDSNSQVSRVYVSGTLTGTGNGVGGLIGEAKVNSTVTNSYAAVNVTNSSGAQIGGLIGIGSGAVTSSAASGNVTQTGTGDSKTGGLVGILYGSVTNCFAKGTVTSSAPYSTGGLVGRANGNDVGPVNASVTKSLAIGNVVIVGGGGYSGGLVGSSYRADIKNSYATGNVTAGTANGKLLGELKQFSSVVSSYATGTPSSLIGSNAGPGSVITTSPPTGTGLAVLNEVISGSTAAWGISVDVNGSTPYILELETSGFYSGFFAKYFITCSGGGSFAIPNVTITSNSGAACKGNVTVPEGVTTINSFAFNNAAGDANPDITQLLLPSTLTTVGDYALTKLSGLTSLSIPSSVTYIGVGSLINSSSLNELTIVGGTAAAPTKTGYTTTHGVNSSIASPYLPQRLILGSGYTYLRQDALEGAGATELVFGSGTYYVGSGNFTSSESLQAIDFGSSTSPAVTIAKQNVTTGSSTPPNPYNFNEVKANPFQGAKIRSIRNCDSNTSSALSTRLKEITNDLGQTLFSLITCNNTPPTITNTNPATTSGGSAPTTVTITGTNFVGLVGVRGVMFGSTPAASYTVNSATSITATPPAAVTSSVYSVTVNTFAGSSTTSRGASDSSLSALTPSAGSLSPSFNSATLNYNASVANPFTTLNITRTVTQVGATTVQYLGETGTTVFTGALNFGTNVIRTVVTSQDGSSTTTYRVNVTRTAAMCSSSGYIRVNSEVSTSNMSCIGAVDLSATRLRELNETFNTSSNVTAVKLPNTLQIISNSAFYNTGIAKLVLPPSITSICAGCIATNSKLTSIEMSGSPSVPVTFAAEAIKNNGNLTRVSFGYSAETSLNLTSYSSPLFLFQGNAKLTTINSCANPNSYLANFLATDNSNDTASPKRKNIFNGTSNPTVACDSGVAVTGGGTTNSGGGNYPIIASFTASVSGTSVTLTSGSITQTSQALEAKEWLMSTDNYTWTSINYVNTDSQLSASYTKTGLTVGETYYFRFKQRSFRDYNWNYDPDITVTIPTVSSVATLSNLALSAGSLNTAFDSTTESYTASVANAVDSVTVTATKTNSGAQVAQYIGATGTTTFTGSLSVGSNIIRTVVTAADGTTKKTYTVTVTRAGSSVATLSALALSAGSLNTTFASSTETYTISVGNSVASTTVTPTRTQGNATITVNGTSVTSGNASGSIPLNVGSNDISVVVTAQDGATTKTYTVTVTRAASTVATLSTLTISPGTLSQTFVSATETYTASVGNAVSSITVTPTNTQANATITVNGTSVTSGSASGAISLNVGSNIITVVVTAQDGATTKTYTLTVTRNSNDASLSALALSTGSLNTSFDGATETYTASVGNSVSSITITPTVTQANATTVQYIGATGTTLFTGALSVGANVIRTVVTAQDGTTKRTYTVTVTRLSNSATLDTFNLSQLTPSVTGTVDNTANTVQLTVPVGTNVSNLVASFTFSAGASVAVGGTAQISGTTANNFTSPVTYVVTSQDSSTVRSYSVTVSIASSPSAPRNLSAVGGQASVSLSWSAPLSDGGRSITGYEVESSIDSTNWTNVGSTNATTTTLNISSLSNNTTYSFRVRATNVSGSTNYNYSTVASTNTYYYVTCSVSGSFFVSSQTIPSAAGVACKGTATIPQGITGVATNAFAPNTSASGTNRLLTAIVFPATGFTEIGLGGFMNLGLTTVTVPASVTTVGQYAFQNNPLTSATITGGSGGASTTLKDSVFGNATAEYGLSTQIALTFGSGKIDVADNFGSNTKFSTVDFGSALNSIAVNAFKKNSIVAGWIPVFPSTITSISSGAFTENPRMRTIRFGSETTTSITSINEFAFDKNYLKSVQYCGPQGNANPLSRYLRDHQTNATIWCDFVAPNAPTISSTSKTSQQVTLNWTKGAGLNEPPTDTYTVQYKSGGGSWTTISFETATPLSLTISNLTNGTTYIFRVAANNIAGASSYSSEVQVTPLGLALIAIPDTSTATAGGFTFNVTNYSSQSNWSASVTAGSGTVSLGTASGNLLPVTVTNMNPGATVSVRITTTRTNYETGTADTAGTSLISALTPTFGTATLTTNGFTVPISNYDANYNWSVIPSSGTAQIISGSVRVTGAAFATSVTATVTATRTGYVTGSANFSATTLAALTATYYGNGNTGGSVPSDTSTYQTNATFAVLGNSGTLIRPGYTFAGWKDNLGADYQPGAQYALANAGVSFYAQWTANPYRIFYNLTEATSGAVPTDANIYAITSTANVRGNPGNLQRTGYVFAGWADNANRNGRIYVSGDTYTVQTSDINFWAAWTPNTYTITYDLNGASGSPSKSSDSYTVGSSVARLALVGTMAKSGYNFGGWATQAVGTPISDSFTVAANTKLFAQWSIASFILTYDLDGGTGTVDSPTAVSYLQQFNLAPATGFTKSSGGISYAFVAWSANSATYNAGQSYIMPAANLTFTATWTRIYNVTYSFSGGSASAIADQQKIALDTITVTSTIPTRTGYTFLSWVDQSGETTTAGATYTVRDGHYLLYAQWQAISYSVTYDVAGGSSTPSESAKTIGQSFLVGAAPTREFYNFNGWFDGTNTYFPGATYLTQSSNVTFTAQWQGKEFRVSYDFNGGAGNVGGSYLHTYGSSAYSLPTTGISLTDYNFNGWSTSPGGTSVGATFAPSSDISLYAIWNIAIYRLNFNGQSGISESATAKVTIGQSIALPNATRANHTLQGWSTQQSGGSVTAAGASFTPSTDATLYAQWALQVFTVTFNANGGTSDSATAAFTYGSTTPLKLPRATRANYVFDNWYSSAVGGYLIGAAGANFTPTSSVTIYAHWIQASLEGLGDSVKIAEVTVLAGSSSSFSAGSQGSTATVEYTADSLPDGTVITAYVQKSTTRASSVIRSDYNYVLSIVVAWLAPDGTVPDTAVGKPIVVTVTNKDIKKGSRIYKLVGTNSRVLGTATEDGRFQALLTQDPLVTVAITEPDSPTAISSVLTEATSALVSWQAPEVTGGSPISEYTATSNTGQSCVTVTTSCTITGLSAGTSYTFAVVARNVIGASNQSLRTASITTSAAPVVVTENTNNNTNNSGGGYDASAALAAAQQQAAQAAAAAELKAAAEKVAAELKAAEEKAAAELKAAEEKVAAELKAAEEKVAAELKAAEEKAAAELKALADAEIAAALAAKKITPAVSLYSISPKMTLSAYDLAYLKKYLSTLKKTATVTCIGYTYTQKTTLAKATALAKKQASAVCSIVKKLRPTLKTSILIHPSKSAPKAAVGAKWVAISYRVDGFQPKK